MSLNQCSFCLKRFTSAYNLRRHQLSVCKGKINRDLFIHQEQIQSLQDEIRRLNRELSVHVIRSEQLHHELVNKQERIDKLENQIFEIAKQPTTTTVLTSNTNTNQRTVNILNQLGAYEFDPETITRILEEKFTKEVFQGGPDKIAELTVEVLLHDAQRKPKVVCTDISRKTFRFIDPITQRLETDPGFLRTHSLLKRPLFEANLNVFSRDFMRVDDDEDTYRNQWKLNDDFISNPNRFPEKLYLYLK